MTEIKLRSSYSLELSTASHSFHQQMELDQVSSRDPECGTLVSQMLKRTLGVVVFNLCVYVHGLVSFDLLEPDIKKKYT